MKLSDLKTGMWVKTRNNDMYLVLKDYETKMYGKGVICTENGFMPFKRYHNDMKCIDDNSFDIVEVFEVAASFYVLNKNKLISIWKEKVIPKLTSLEMEFLKALRPIYKNGWIAEDKCGEVWVYETKPEKIYDEWDSDGDVKEIGFTRNIFTEKVFKWLSYDDEEPCYIPDLIKGSKENE